MKTDQKRLEKEITANGYSVVDGGQHKKVFDADGRMIVTISASASDHRALQNMIGDLRRAGVLPSAKEARACSGRKGKARKAGI